MHKGIIFWGVSLIFMIFLISEVSSVNDAVTLEKIASVGNKGVSLAETGDLNGALDLFNLALELSTQINDSHGRGLALANIGKIYLMSEEYDTSRAYLEEAVKIFQDTQDKYYEATFSAKLAEANLRLLNWDNAKYYAYNSVNLFATLNNFEAVNEVNIIFGDIYYGQANVYMSWGDLNNSLYYLKLAEEEYKSGSPTVQRKVSYAYCIMKEGDLYSRSHDSEKAIENFKEATQLLDIILKENSSLKEVEGIKKLVLAKENFERGILETDKLNFNLSSYYFSLAELGFKNALDSGVFKDKPDMLKGYFYYSSSNKNYFLFMVNGDPNTRYLAEDQINFARDSFLKAGFEDLARKILENKLVNFPEGFINYDDNALFLSGLSFYNLSYIAKISTQKKGYIHFSLKYRYQIPNSVNQKVMFCCKEFCSDWKEITDSNPREVKIEVWSDVPREIYCDIEAYGENNPSIPLSSIEKYYQFSIIDISLDKHRKLNVLVDSYVPIEISIKKPIYERIFDILKLPQVILSLIIAGFTVWSYRKKIILFFKSFSWNKINILKKESTS